MSFITKNPLAAPIADNTPSLPPHGTRGLFPKSDGWYEIDSDGNVAKIGTGDGSSNPIIDLEVSSPIAPSNYEINIPELDELMTEGIYRLHHADTTIFPPSHSYAYCIISYWIQPPRANQALLTENGIYERSGNSTEWSPWTKLATQEELNKKLDAGTETNYVSKLSFLGYTNDGIGHVTNAINVYDKNGNQRMETLFNGDTSITQNSENLITSGAVYDAIGDIDTALENIIAKYGLGGDVV